MGSINRFDLNKLIKKYNVQYFFETGTWKGDGLAYASKFPFKKLLSCEIMEEIYHKANNRFKNHNNIQIKLGASEEALASLNNEITGNCLFWLDAHYPGAEEGLHTYNEIKNETIRLPLHKELLLINELRSNYKDLILVDDLRIYEDGPYKKGNMPDNIIPPSIRNIDFAYDLFAATHEIIKLHNDHGYLIIIPKNVSLTTNGNILNKLYRKYIKRFIYP